VMKLMSKYVSASDMCCWLPTRSRMKRGVCRTECLPCTHLFSNLLQVEDSQYIIIIPVLCYLCVCVCVYVHINLKENKYIVFIGKSKWSKIFQNDINRKRYITYTFSNTK
jgi:hypothetical protein